MIAVYAIVNGNDVGWTTARTLGLLGASAVLMIAFLLIESRVESPLVPLRLFKLRNLATANGVGVLWSAAMFAWFFLSALYLQLVLGYSPLQVGLAFLPTTIIMGAFSLGLSAKLVMRYGIRTPLGVGMLLATAGLVLFARAPVDGNLFVDVFPSMVLLGLGAGIAFNPLLLAAMGDVEPHEAGLASGVVNTAFMMGGALGLAVLASVAAHRTQTLTASGEDAITALNGGYHVAFLVGSMFSATAGILALALLRPKMAAMPRRRAGTRRSGDGERLAQAVARCVDVRVHLGRRHRHGDAAHPALRRQDSVVQEREVERLRVAHMHVEERACACHRAGRPGLRAPPRPSAGGRRPAPRSPRSAPASSRRASRVRPPSSAGSR